MGQIQQAINGLGTAIITNTAVKKVEEKLNQNTQAIKGVNKTLVAPEAYKKAVEDYWSLDKKDPEYYHKVEKIRKGLSVNEEITNTLSTLTADEFKASLDQDLSENTEEYRKEAEMIEKAKNSKDAQQMIITQQKGNFRQRKKKLKQRGGKK